MTIIGVGVRGLEGHGGLVLRVDTVASIMIVVHQEGLLLWLKCGVYESKHIN